jgi:hypothetical protein
VSQELSQARTSLGATSPANHMPDQAAGVQEVMAMIPTMDVQIECPWCGQTVLITDAASALVAQCDACAVSVDLTNPVPARVVSPHSATAMAA